MPSSTVADLLKNAAIASTTAIVAALLACMIVSACALTILLRHIDVHALRLYTLLATLLAAYFLLIHARPDSAHRFPKELAVGIFFPAAVFIPTVARLPQLRLDLLPFAILLAALCSLNCLFLYAWEHPHDRAQAHSSTRWATRHLVPLTCTIAALSLALILISPQRATLMLTLVHSRKLAASPPAPPTISGIAFNSIHLLLCARRPRPPHTTCPTRTRTHRAMSSERNDSPNFDRVASIYRWAEYLSLGPLLEHTRTALLGELNNPQHALVLGDGDGRFLEQLLLCYPQCTATAVDTSAAMLAQLRRRCAFATKRATSRLKTLHRSALEIDTPPHTDLIATHFLLDCFTQSEVDALTARLAAQLSPGALWLLSDFALPASPFLRPFAQLYIASLYAAFRLLTGLRVRHLPDPQSALARAGMQRIARKTFLFGLLYTELWGRE